MQYLYSTFFRGGVITLSSIMFCKIILFSNIVSH